MVWLFFSAFDLVETVVKICRANLLQNNFDQIKYYVGLAMKHKAEVGAEVPAAYAFLEACLGLVALRGGNYKVAAAHFRAVNVDDWDKVGTGALAANRSWQDVRNACCCPHQTQLVGD